MPLWKLDDPIHTGTIIKPHSYLGAARVAFLFYGLEEILIKGTYIYVLLNQKPVPYLIESIQWIDEKTALLKLVDINNEVEVDGLRGKEIVMPQSMLALAEEDEAEGEELIGYKIEDGEGNSLGEVTDIIEGPQNLLQVVHKGSLYLIPFHPDLIVKINHKKKLILADLPEGLIDL